jgi:tetratricopeptide (TPR) repeat protein
MRRSGSIDIPHITITDHNICKETARKKMTAKEQDDIAAFLGLECLTSTKTTELDLAKGYLALYDKFMKDQAVLDSVAFYLKKSKATAKDKFKTQVHYYFAAEQYAQIVDLHSTVTLSELNDAWTLYRIGEAFYRTQQLPKALPYFEKAVKLKKYNLDFQEKLGVLYARLGLAEKAKDVFNFVLTEDAARPLTLSNLGLIAANTRDMDRALYYYNKALSFDPDFETALMNKAALLIYQKKNADARKVLEHLIKKHPANPQAREAMKTLM